MRPSRPTGEPLTTRLRGLIASVVVAFAFVGCEGGSDVASCTQTAEQEADGEFYCFTGYNNSVGYQENCSATDSCTGPGYATFKDVDENGTIFLASARCSNGKYIVCEGTLSASSGVHGNGEKYVSCFGPGLIPDACW